MNFSSKHSPCVGIRTCYDYSPFGVECDGRTVSGGYRFGYQGSEKDNEAKGSGNSYTTEFRQLDPRLGRWLSVDPVIQPWQSSFCSMDNNSLVLTDPLGLFGSYFDAKKYKRKHGIDGENRKDGETFMIVDLNKHVTYSKGSQWEVEHYYGADKKEGVIKSTYILLEKVNKRSEQFSKWTDALGLADSFGAFDGLYNSFDY